MTEGLPDIISCGHLDCWVPGGDGVNIVADTTFLDVRISNIRVHIVKSCNIWSR